MPLELKNPVLEGYIQGVQERRAREQQQHQQLMQDAENERQEQQLQAYMKNLDFEHKHKTSQLDLEKQRLNQEKLAHTITAMKTIGDMRTSGTMRDPTPGEQNSSPMGGQQFGDPNGGGFIFDPRQYGTPETKLQQDVTRARTLGPIEAANAGAKTSATTKAETDITEPLQRLRDANKMQFEREQELVKEKAALTHLSQSIEGNKAIARIHGQYGLDEARIRTMGGINTADEWAQTISPHILGTAQKPFGNNMREQLGQNHLTAGGFVDLTTKDTDKLNGLHQIDPLFNTLNEFIKTAPTTTVGAAKDLVLSKVPTTDLANLKARIMSMGGTLAKNVDAQTGRMANAEIERVLGDLKPGQKMSNLQKSISLLRERVSSAALDGALGRAPDKQKLLVLKQNKFDPASFVTNFEGKVIPRYKQDPSDGEWLVFDSSRKGYVSVDAK